MAASPPLLGDREVHVWGASLLVPEAEFAPLAGLLSTDEVARSRTLAPLPRRRFVMARALLRRLLGGYLDRSPSDLNLRTRPDGKPVLWNGRAQTKLRFNVSHSGDVALYAFALEREVGVDVELVRSGLACRRIAESFFARAETETLRRLRDERLEREFFRLWTRKEAYAKARGSGLRLPLDSFDVVTEPGRALALSKAPSESLEVSRWGLRDVEVGPGRAAAVAAEGHDWRTRSLRRPIWW